MAKMELETGVPGDETPKKTERERIGKNFRFDQDGKWFALECHRAVIFLCLISPFIVTEQP